MVTLGIDQSFRSTGLVILENDTILHASCFHANKTDNRFKQANDITIHISNLTQEYNVSNIAIEGLAFSLIGNVGKDLAGLQYVIITYLQEVLHYQISIFSPSKVKKFATTSGRAKKNEMIEALPERVLLKFKSLGYKKSTGLSDLTDAYFIAKLNDSF